MEIVSAYCVFNFTVTDEAGYQTYIETAGPTLEPFDAELLVWDRASEAVEGEPNLVTVVLRFPSKEKARAWYNSAGYQSVVHNRTDNSYGSGVLCEGYEPA